MMQTDTSPSSTPSQRRKDELKANLISLTEACPVDKCNPEDCPLYRVRKMKPTERLLWFTALSEQDLTHLAAYHYICLNTKLASRKVEQDA
jgi:hypothetical protein